MAVVSYVLNNSNYVKEETREKVLRAIEELDYQPNMIARSLKTRKSQQLAVLVNYLGNPFEAGILLNLEEKAREAGYFVFFQAYRADQESELRHLFMRRADGIVLIGQQLSESTIRHFRQNHLPLLSVTTPGLRSEPIPCIDLDWMAEIRKIIRHFKEIGRTRIAFMLDSAPTYHVVRHKAFLQAMREEGLRFDERHLLDGKGMFQEGHKAMMEEIHRGFDYDAILCSNDLMAVGVVTACHDSGVRVPEQLAIAGCEDILMSSTTPSPLTVIHYPRVELGAAAVDMMLKLLEGEQVESRILEGQLIVRSSTVDRS